MSREDFYQKMVANIDRTGRTVLHIMDRPPFSYSVGNALVHLPELLLIGFDAENSMNLINEWSHAMIDRGREFGDRELVDVGARFPCLAVHCVPSVKDRYTLMATSFLGHQDYRVTQMVAPDPEGRFPGDPGCIAPYSEVPVWASPTH